MSELGTVGRGGPAYCFRCKKNIRDSNDPLCAVCRQMDEAKVTGGDVPDPAMPFGIHRGVKASMLGVHYLDWMLGRVEDDARLAGFAGELLTHLKSRPDWSRLDDE